MEVFKRSTEANLSPLFGVEFVKRGFKVLKFAIKSLTALGNEMFRLTNATKGGLLLMLIFFYSAFVMGTTLWIETGGDDPACDSFQMCTYTMMRLTFYDGTGFDFTYSLTSKHRFLFFLCIVYMCLTSFGILNGLVGIFGTAFSAASDDAFNDSDDEEEIENDDDGEEPDDQDLKDVYTSFRGMYTDENNNNNHHNASGYNNARRGSKTGAIPPNIELGEELYKQVDDDDESDVSEMGEKIQPLAYNAKQPSMSKMEVKALQHRLKGALGAKSHFAMMELTKMAQEPPVKKPAPPRRTLRDIIQANKIGQGANSNVHPVLGNLSSPDRPPLHAPDKMKPAAGAGASHHHLGMAGMFGTPKKQKNLHAAVGMFASLKKQKSSKGLHHAGSSAAHNSSSGPNSGPFREYLLAQQAAHQGDHRGSGVASTAEMKAVNASVHNLQRTVETQSQTMSMLIKHIEFLSQQLYDLNPTIVAKPIAIVVPENETKPPPRKFSNVFVSPRVSADKVPESAPQAEAEPPASLGPSPAKSMAWGFGLKAAFTNNSSAYAIEKPTPLHAPVPVQASVPVTAVEKVNDPAPAVVPASSSVSVPAVAPVVQVVEVHPPQSAVQEPIIEPIKDDAPKPVQQHVSPRLTKPDDNNTLEDKQDEQDIELPSVARTAEEPLSPATLTELASRTSPVPVLPIEETHRPAISPHVNSAPVPARVSPRSVPVPEPNRELSDSSTLDSLSMSRDIVHRGLGIDLPKIAFEGEAAGLYSPVWTPANITNKNKSEADVVEEVTPAPGAIQPQPEPHSSSQNSHNNKEGQSHQSREESKSPSDSVKSAHRHRRHHAPGNRTSSSNQSQNSPAPHPPNNSTGMSILGAMGKFKPQKANPLDEFTSSALSKSPTVLDLPENEGGSLSDIWNPHNRPSTSPFKVHRQDARPSTTPNATSSSLEGFNIRGGNQHGEAGSADGARAGAGERRANTGNGWLTEFSQGSTVGPDDVIEMPGAEQNI